MLRSFDLHLHSPFSRAVSKHMTLSEVSRQAQLKGIDVLTTGDWTHPAWLAEIQSQLLEVRPGVYHLKEQPLHEAWQRPDQPNPTEFLLITEISCIFSQGGKVRRVHLLVGVSSLEKVLLVNRALTQRGCKLAADGRPIIGLSCHDLTELVLSCDAQALIIPAHIWTPWFGVLGSKGGFDTLAEAFGDLAPQIFAVETGLSSDPGMNWRITELEDRAIVSFSDAHSPAKLGRELTIFEDRSGATGFEYGDLWRALGARSGVATSGGSRALRLQSTVEFYPEEGKYHWDGHRACNVVQAAAITRQNGQTCPVCGKALTVGVEYRVEELASQPGDLVMRDEDDDGVVYKAHRDDASRPSFISLVPLQEILAEVYGVGVSSKKVQRAYLDLTTRLASELTLIWQMSIAELEAVLEPRLVKAILQVRRGQLEITPGYDGVFGQVHLKLG